MATAVATKKELEITLKLSEDEALTLIQITRLVGGDPDTTVRRHVAEIASALCQAFGGNLDLVACPTRTIFSGGLVALTGSLDGIKSFKK